MQRTPLDASRLLIALLATNSPARAVAAVQDFGVLECTGETSSKTSGLTLGALCGDEFERPHILEKVLAAIIAGFGQSNFCTLLEKNARILPDVGAFDPHIDLRLWDTQVEAQINIGGTLYRYQHPAKLADENAISKCRTYQLRRSQSKSTLQDLYDEEVASLQRSTSGDAWSKLLNKYCGIRSERCLTMVEIKPIAKFVCGVSE